MVVSLWMAAEDLKLLSHLGRSCFLHNSALPYSYRAIQMAEPTFSSSECYDCTLMVLKIMQGYKIQMKYKLNDFKVFNVFSVNECVV